MSIFFMDSSALVKRYMPEVGTVWVRSITSNTSKNDIVIAQITPIEILSALARQYHDQQVNLTVLQSFRRLLVRQSQNQYQVLSLSNSITLQALDLHERYRLRAYDSVQLASALEFNVRLKTRGRAFIFLSADVRLLQAAASEGLSTDNPNNHP